MKTTLDKQISKRIKSLMKKYGVKGVTIASVLDIRPSSASDMLLGKSPWRISYLVEIALYFELTLEDLIFGDPKFVEKMIKKNSDKRKKNLQEYIAKEPLTEEFKKQLIKTFNLDK